MDPKTLQELIKKGLNTYNTVREGLKTSTLKQPDFATFVKFVDQIVSQYQSQVARITHRELRRLMNSFDKSFNFGTFQDYASKIPELKGDERRRGEFTVNKEDWEKAYQELMRKISDETIS